ncbi:MAG: M48 family metalloprotease, partial [Vicinamibacteria bacterium]
AEVRKEYGVYLEKPELRAYVTSIGMGLAGKSARPAIQYHFEVVDNPIVNAFALPGGFVYITRGILERMNSEDELAAVMGHEIAHVAARHGAAQISKAYIAQAGLIALAVLGNPGTAAALGDLANLAVNLALQGYSREYERQADDFGFQYAASAGYNPKGSVDLLQTLARLEKKEPSTVEAFFSSHPRTSERIGNARQEVDDLRRGHPEAVRQPLKRDEFLSHLDGMAVGVWNGRVLVLGSRLYDKEHGIVMEVPRGFLVKLGDAPLVAVFEREKEKLQAGCRIEPLPKKKTPKELFEEYRKQAGSLKLTSEGPRAQAALPIHEAVFTGRESGKPIEVRKAFAVHEGFGISLTVVSPAEKAEAGRAAFEQMAGTVATLTPA